MITSYVLESVNVWATFGWKHLHQMDNCLARIHRRDRNASLPYARLPQWLPTRNALLAGIRPLAFSAGLEYEVDQSEISSNSAGEEHNKLRAPHRDRQAHKLAQVVLDQGVSDMGDKGKRDKGKREQRKTAQLSPREKRKLKKEKKNSQTLLGT